MPDARTYPPADDTTTRLTLTLSGAIALGAYEAGVVSQIAYTLARWNEARPEQPPLAVIDVISGASAGAVTGAMLARHLITGSDPGEFVRLHLEQWKGVTFAGLLPEEGTEGRALLSARPIDTTARSQYNSLKPAEPEIRRARVRQTELLYSCTLTSLQPIPFEFKYEMGTRDEGGARKTGTMIGETQRDYIFFSLANAEEPVVELPPNTTRESRRRRSSSWDRLFAAAVASAAIPFAWEPICMARSSDDYPGYSNKPTPQKTTEGIEHAVGMRYVDGGTFNNMPLDLAAETLGFALGGVTPDEDRVYLLIRPFPDEEAPKLGTAIGDSWQDGGRDSETSLQSLARQTLSAIREQSFMMDVYRSQKVNRRLEHREQFLLPLIAQEVRGIPDGDLENALSTIRAGLTEYLKNRLSHSTPDSVLARYKRYAAPACPLGKLYLGLQEKRREIFLLKVAYADYIADLSDKSPIRFERIFPEKDLASSDLALFGGFADPLLLQADYEEGMEGAYQWLVGFARRKGWPDPASAKTEITPLTAAQRQALSPKLSSHIKEELSDRVLERVRRLLLKETGKEKSPAWQLGSLLFRKFADEMIRFEEQNQPPG